MGFEQSNCSVQTGLLRLKLQSEHIHVSVWDVVLVLLLLRVRKQSLFLSEECTEQVWNCNGCFAPQQREHQRSLQWLEMTFWTFWSELSHISSVCISQCKSYWNNSCLQMGSVEIIVLIIIVISCQSSFSLTVQLQVQLNLTHKRYVGLFLEKS